MPYSSLLPLLLACSAPPPPAPVAAPPPPAPVVEPAAAPVALPPAAALSPEPDALSGEVGEIDPGGTDLYVVRLRALKPGCELSLLHLPSIEPRVLSALPVCPQEIVVDGDRLVALTPGASTAAWGVPLGGGAPTPLDAAPDVGSKPLLRPGPSAPASADALPAEKLAGLNTAAAMSGATWAHAAGAPLVAWLRTAAGGDAGPVLVEHGDGWALLPGTPTLDALRVERRGNWLTIGSQKEARLFDLRNDRLVWKDASTTWLWPEGAAPPAGG